MKPFAPVHWLLFAFMAVSGASVLAADAPIVYPPRIGAFFEKKCATYHSKEEAKSDLNLDSLLTLMLGGESGETMVTPGKVASSHLWKMISEGEMPPKDEPRLSNEEKTAIRDWINNGRFPTLAVIEQARTDLLNAEARKHWAFQPVTEHAIPRVKNTAWPRSIIDRFILARLESEKLKPAGDANANTLLRRIYYDLTGLPPSPAEIKKFVGESALDFDAALTSLVDRLLDTPEFGERWGRHWLDVVRYSDTLSGGANYTLVDAWRYRDYVIDSFNKDTPYDRFITEQIAGDLLPFESPEERQTLLIATGFLALGPKDFTDQDKVKLMADAIDEQMDTMGKAIMGMAIGCARCHSHKFDPVPVDDYYALAGIFRSTKTLAVMDDTKSFANSPSWNRLPLPTMSDEEIESQQQNYKAKMDALIKKRKDLEGQIKKLRLSIKKSGTGINDKIETDLAAMEAEKTKVFNDFQGLQNLKRYFGDLDAGILAVIEREAKGPSKINIAGNPRELGREVPRGVIRAFGSKCADIPEDQSGRLQLTDWLTNGKHPLTSRVMVNRIWGHLMGNGLVSTADDFGTRGSPPSHPGLLDYLATQFVSESWSVKKLIRQIMLSRVYRIASKPNKKAESMDPNNTLLWKRSTRRLDIEALHDSLLRFGGQLSEERGGPTLLHAGVLGQGYRKGIERDGLWKRRAVYLPVYRGAVVEGTAAFRTFDFADPNLVTGHRIQSLVPTQALFLMNNELTLDCAEDFARRLLEEEKTDDARVRLAYLSVLGRPVTEEELQQAKGFLKTSANQPDASINALTGFCQVLFSSSEFLFIN